MNGALRPEKEAEGGGGGRWGEAISRGDTITQNKNQLRILDCAGSPGLLRLRAPDGAQDMALYTAAAKAARMRDLQAHVVTAESKHRALALWGPSLLIGGLTTSYPQPGAPKGPHPIL